MIAMTPACTRPRSNEKSADLWLGGDVNLGDGGNEQLQSIAPIVQGAVGIVNLEGPVAERADLQRGTLGLWNNPNALAELAALNVRVAGIANNHAGDAGADAATRSALKLAEHAILPAGGPAGTALLRQKDLTIAVSAHDLTAGVPANLAADLKAARERSNVLISTFHVTGPPSYVPRPELQRAVELAYQAGASVIAAHGTHALGPVERRNNAVIAWGLGNLTFACDCTQEQDAIVLRVHVEPGKAPVAEVLPIQAGINNQAALPSSDAKGIFDLLEAIGSGKLTRQGDRASF
jgi:poly-gamma-glutamate capsule biosynthesis protein CapA/YwtB (metallophosphatase superfamily)